MNILITGVSGTGKSTVCKKLLNLGYNAVDIENVDGMFDMYHKGTKEIFEDYSNHNPDHIKNAEWLCDVPKLKKLLEFKEPEVRFFCGIASNMDDLIPLFDKVIVLQPSPDTLNERLKNREGTEDIGNTQEGRDVVLGWKGWWEEEMHKKGAILLDANGSPQEIAEKVLEVLGLSK